MPISDPGTPSYVNEGYVRRGYQRYDGAVIVLPVSTGTDNHSPPSGPITPTGPSLSPSGFLGVNFNPGRYYFAWTDAPTSPDNIVPFDTVAHRVEDEKIFSYDLEQKEGNAATLTLEIPNPGMGLLAPSRKKWAWFSVDFGDGTLIPLFFGRLTAIPSDLTDLVITVRFISSPPNILTQKRAVAETLKVRPFYDPVFIDESRHADPDTVLEGRSALWHIDRVTLEVSVSDLIAGEDGEEVFEASDSFYDSVKPNLDQPPLRSVSVDALVNWTQQAVGRIDMGTRIFQSYAGDGILGGWPKTQTGLGAGWSVFSSTVQDVNLVATAPTISINDSWHWPETTQGFDPELNRPHNGDIISWSHQESYPQMPALAIEAWRYEKHVVGEEPFEPPPGDDPAWEDPDEAAKFEEWAREYPGQAAEVQKEVDTVYVGFWTIRTTLKLQYEAQRERMETIRFTLNADLQPVVTDSGDPAADFSQDSELLQLNGVAGLPTGVPFGRFLGDFGNSGPTSGELFDFFTVQNGLYCYQVMVPYTNGFTWDPDATWFSTFFRLVPHFRGEWQPNTVYTPNDIVLVYPNTTLITPGSETYISNYLSLVNWNATYVTFRVLVGHTSAASFDPLAVDVAIRPLYTFVFNPPPIGDVARRAYFPSDRGLWSLEHLIARARAHILARARALRISFDCALSRACALTCRKNARLYDTRLPGGTVVGKIVEYHLRGHGDAQSFIGNVTIACAVGNGAISGGEGDVGYSPPVDATNDDGLVFPLTKAQAVVSEEVGDTLAVPPTWSDADKYVAALHNNPSLAGQPTSQAQQDELLNAQYRGPNAQVRQQGADAWSRSLKAAYEQMANDLARTITSIQPWYQLVLKPVVNGPFSTEYDVTVTNLEVEKQVDLEATSNF